MPSPSLVTSSLRPLRHRWTAWLVAASLAVVVMYAGFRAVEYYASGSWHYWYHATCDSGAKFVGAKGKKGDIEYFSVRVGDDRNAEESPAECDLQLHWSERAYLVRETGLDDLAEMGIATNDNPDTGITTASFAGADDRYQDYGVGFSFRNGRPNSFYATHSSHNGVSCPFMLSAPGRQPVRFPITEDQLRESFCEPESVVGVPGK